MIYTNILHFYERLLRLSITIRQLRDRTIPTRNNQIVPDYLKVVKLSQGYSKGIATLYAEEEAFPYPALKRSELDEERRREDTFVSTVITMF